MILIISSETDLHATTVMKELNSIGADTRLLDLSQFPQKSELQITIENQQHQGSYSLRENNINFNFSECSVIWWRRPQPYSLHEDITSSEDQQFAYTESHSAFSGLWLMLDTYWINHPTRDEEAARKVYQLKVAKDLGFSIPKTCITNSPKQAKQFINQQGVESTIYKAFSGTEKAWRETRLLKQNEIELINSVKYAPVIFQEYIPAKVDLRITVVGEQIFAAAIHSQQTSYKADFRMTMSEAKVEAFKLPEKVKNLIHRFMESMGLVYGAIDMRLTPENNFVFLEINPSGQWLFIEQQTKQRITKSLVDLMLSKDI